MNIGAAGFRVALTGALAGLIGCAGPAWFGKAIVKDLNGSPCFQANDELINRNLRDIVITDESSRPPPSVWEIELTSSDIAEREGCIRYGLVSSNMQTKVDAVPLMPGKAYGIFLSASSKVMIDPLHGYVAQFCLIPNGKSSVRVHQIAWDSVRKVWDVNVCASDSKGVYRR